MSLTPTGGTSQTLQADSQIVVGNLHLIDASVTDYRIRPNMTAKVKQPTLDSAGVYSKDKKSLTYVEPMILASGKTVFNLIRIEREIHPEASAQVQAQLLFTGAQMLVDTDFTNFWNVGSYV